MKTIKAKVEINIPDDPEFCGICLKISDDGKDICDVTGETLKVKTKGKFDFVKCDQCKAAYKKANDQESNASKAMRLLGLLSANQSLDADCMRLPEIIITDFLSEL